MSANWGKRPSARAPDNLAEFVTGHQPVARLALNIPKDLHTRIKVACAAQQRPMRVVIIELLEQHFPAADAKVPARSSEG